MSQQQTPGTPKCPRVSQQFTPQRLKPSRDFPFSSPYSGKSPLPMPILNHSHYQSEAEMFIDEEVRSEKLELFEKGVGKTELLIPDLGCDLNELPFFDQRKSTQFIESINRINSHMNRLSKLNNSIVEMNESLGAYLFGLYQNAWCVNMNENFGLDQIEKLETVKKLEQEVKELEEKLEISKRRSSLLKRQKLQLNERRKSTMPPPSISRFNGRDRPMKRTRDNPILSNANKPAFLKAGSRKPMFQIRNNRSITTSRDKKLPSQRTNSSLNLSYATKMKTIDNFIDSSNDSSGDTSEVQTLNTIRRIGVRNQQRDRRVPLQKKNINKPKSWEVNHRKPFR